MGFLQTINEITGIEAASHVEGFIDTTSYTANSDTIGLTHVITSSPLSELSDVLTEQYSNLSDQLRMSVFAQVPDTLDYTVDRTIRKGREFHKRLKAYRQDVFARNIGVVLLAGIKFDNLGRES